MRIRGLGRIKRILRKLSRKRLSKRPRLYLVNAFYQTRPEVTRMLQTVSRRLRAQRINSVPLKMDEMGGEAFLPQDLIITHHTLPNPGMLKGAACLGLNNLNRLERLQLAAAAGFPVMPYAHPKNHTELLSLFERWKVDTLLLKKQESFQGKEITLLSREKIGTLAWGSGDVFCPILREDPKTYKAHLLGETIICTYYLDSPPVERLEEMKQYLGLRKKPGVSLFEPTPRLATQLRNLGRFLMEHGVGYCSIDMMKQADDWLAIELNTNAVGTEGPWVNWFELIADRYTVALALVATHLWPSLTSSTRVSKTGGN